jgi:outer membrane receptor protein involved in Fe transport
MQTRIACALMGTALAGTTLLCSTTRVLAQSASTPSSTAPQNASPRAAVNKPPGSVGLEEVVVTARATPQTKLRSSISVTTLSAATIAQSDPSSAADVLRDVPGIRAEASGGEGNANIAVRGLPVATGGSKYAQFQEDGLPILQFGDIDFATADQFLRVDATLDHLEVVRGGSASTFTSDAPGAVFNFISKTGDRPGGIISTEQGLSYDQHRFDFDYGGPLGNGWFFNIGGFYREGEGPRSADYEVQNGGQLKANITKKFDEGFVRLYFKYLNDTSPAFLPVPISITGNPKSPNINPISGFSPQYGTFLSPFFQKDSFYDHNGAFGQTDLNQGYQSLDTAVGGEVNYDIYGGINFDDKFRAARIDGSFLGVYPANVEDAQTLATAIGGAGATLRYATGPLAGTSIANPGALGGNGLLSQNTLFNTTLNNLDNVTNDAKLSKHLDYGDIGSFDLAAGYFHSTQDIVEDWHWNSYLETVQGRDATLIDVVNAAGKLVTFNGNTGFNAGFGNVARYYDLRYNTDAPYASAVWQHGPFNLDGSIRYDFASADGTYIGATPALLATFDPAIPTLGGYLVNNATSAPVHYTKGYVSYSIGLNYLIDRDLAVFVRGSQGGRANAERILFGGGVDPSGGVAQNVAIDLVQQIEGGVKYRNQYGSIFATAFYAHTQETNADITDRLQPFVAATYAAEGLEIQSNLHYGDFSIALGATYTHSRIVADQITPQDTGNIPQRQADFVWQITPGYYAERFNFGVNIIGTTSSYADDANDLVMPGYTEVNLFANYLITPALNLSFHMNNVGNVIGLTEIDNAPNAQGIATARSIDGRTAKIGLSYTF